MTDEQWRAAHRGKLTASEFHIVMHGGVRAQNTLMRRLRAERAGEPSSFERGGGEANPTKWGKTYESDARRMFSLVTGHEVRPVTELILHRDLPDVGCTPDGDVLDECENPWAGLEIKVPYDESIHARYRALGLPDIYRPQTQGSMWVTRREAWWFCSYNPRANDAAGELVPFFIRRDEAYIQRLEKKVREFLGVLESGDELRVLDPVTDEIPRLF